jgi:hypothetical protein
MARAAALVLVVGGLACAQGNRAPQDAPPVQRDATIDGNGCSVQPCSILPQCGCTGNTTCDADSTDASGTACRSINVMGTETSTCGGPQECDAGYACVGGVSFRSCKKYCSGDADCGAPRGRCAYTLTGNGGQPIADVPKVCSSNCDPADTTGASCPSTMKCTIFNIGPSGMPDFVADCSPAGSMTQGADCKNPTATGGPIESRCAKGYQCITFDSGTTYQCRRICTAPGTTTGCGANMCTGFTPAVTIGGTTYGICNP